MSKQLPRVLPRQLKPRMLGRRGLNKFRVRFKENITGKGGHVSWFRYLVQKQKDFLRAVNTRMISKENMQLLRSGVTAVIQDKVYEAYYHDGLNRTNRLKKSATVTGLRSDGKGAGGFAFYMKDHVAPAKRGALKGRNYAIFFLYPDELSTFIPEAGTKDPPRNYRDFFGIESDEGTIKAFMAQHTPPIVSKSFLSAMDAKKPKQQG